MISQRLAKVLRHIYHVEWRFKDEEYRLYWNEVYSPEERTWILEELEGHIKNKDISTQEYEALVGTDPDPDEIAEDLQRFLALLGER